MHFRMANQDTPPACGNGMRHAMAHEEMQQQQRGESEETASVRHTDIEPYTALRWLGTLFKAAALFLIVALIGEFMAGIRFEGTRALPILLGELARTAVLAVVMWGAGDLVRLLITVGNDVRAERILLARLVYRTPPRSTARSDEAADSVERREVRRREEAA